MGGNARLAHFYYAFGIVFLRRCYHQILGPRRRLLPTETVGGPCSQTFQRDSLTGIARVRRSCSHSLRPVGGSENKTTSFFGLQPLVAHAGVEDMPIYAPAYRSGDCPFVVKSDPGARRRMRTVSWWCSSRNCATAAREYGGVPFHFANDAPWLDVRRLKQEFRPWLSGEASLE
jgi:hypothetical protein